MVDCSYGVLIAVVGHRLLVLRPRLRGASDRPSRVSSAPRKRLSALVCSLCSASTPRCHYVAKGRQVEKEYYAQVMGEIEAAALQQLSSG